MHQKFCFQEVFWTIATFACMSHRTGYALEQFLGNAWIIGSLLMPCHTTLLGALSIMALLLLAILAFSSSFLDVFEEAYI